MFSSIDFHNDFSQVGSSDNHDYVRPADQAGQLYQGGDKLIEEDLNEFDAFTDIEFNPKRSFNCQAKSCALFVFNTVRL